MSTTPAALETRLPSPAFSARLAAAWTELLGRVLPPVESWTLELTQEEVDADLRQGYGRDRD